MVNADEVTKAILEEAIGIYEDWYSSEEIEPSHNRSIFYLSRLAFFDAHRCIPLGLAAGPDEAADRQADMLRAVFHIGRASMAGNDLLSIVQRQAAELDRLRQKLVDCEAKIARKE